MKVFVFTITAASLVALGGLAKADDHLWQAEQPGHGLSDNPHSQGFRSDTLAESPGQGSPFTGNEDHQTPASEVSLDKPHANPKPKEH